MVAWLGVCLMFGLPYVVIGVVAYPIMVVTTLVFIAPLHLLIKRFSLGSPSQLFVALIGGGIGGFAISLLFQFNRAMDIGVSSLDRHRLFENVILGVVVATLSWTMYTYGPLVPRKSAGDFHGTAL